MTSPIDSRPCACGAVITVPRGATAAAIGAVLLEHYATARHEAWSIAWRWSELVPDRHREDIPSGAELRLTRADRLVLR